MPAAGEDAKSLTNVWKKIDEQQLFNELEDEYGFPRATFSSLVQRMLEFIEDNYGNISEYISTLRKNDRPILSSIKHAFKGEPFIPTVAQVSC